MNKQIVWGMDDGINVLYNVEFKDFTITRNILLLSVLDLEKK